MGLTVASDSPVGRFSFSAGKYCEWIINKDLHKPGVTNEAPAVTPLHACCLKGWTIQLFATWRRG
jgi:hypothetical protein